MRKGLLIVVLVLLSFEIIFAAEPIEFDAFAKTIVDLGFYWLVVNRPPTS